MDIELIFNFYLLAKGNLCYKTKNTISPEVCILIEKNWLKVKLLCLSLLSLFILIIYLFCSQDDSIDNDMVAELYREIEKEMKSRYEGEGGEEEEMGTEEGMREVSEEIRSAMSEEGVNIQEEAMYVRDGNLLWPRVVSYLIIFKH